MGRSTEVLIIRHGQTDWNKMKRLQGHSDIPLNEKGRQQALALAETLQTEALDGVYASDLMRALHTAEEIAKWHQLEVRADRGLRERCYGAFEGMHPKEIEEQYPESHKRWHAADPDHVFPTGERQAESIREFHHRAIAALSRCAERHAGKKIAVITHFGIIEAAFRVAHDIPLGTRQRMPVLNTSINRFSVLGDEIRMLAWGEAEHLAPLRQPPEYLKHF